MSVGVNIFHVSLNDLLISLRCCGIHLYCHCSNIDAREIRGVGLQVSKLESADATKQGKFEN